jgi:hypothetical protein
MKNLSKEQISVIVISLLSLLLLAYQVVTIDFSVEKEDLKGKYRSSIDSVLLADSLIKELPEGQVNFVRDVYNFKIKPRKTVSSKPADSGTETSAVRTRWVNSKDLELYPKSQISYALFFNGKSRFTINGITKEYNVGDELKVGNFSVVEQVVGTNEPTGNTRAGAVFTGKIILITERAVYVESNDKDRVIRFRPGADSDYYARNLIQDTQTPETPQTPTDTRGGRPPRR